jgi:hypothetical protein
MQLLHTSQYGVRRSRQSGITTILVVGFMGIFMIILGTVTSYAFQQAKYGRALFAREQALHIAEAGLEYYRWLISHDVNSGGTMMTTGAALTSLPGSYTVTDPEGGTLGSAALTATPSKQCGVVQWVDVTSEGTADSGVGFPRTLTARLMRPSVAQYSYIVGGNVWAGSDRDIKGPYHSNGGIIMDGTNNADVTSGVSTWTCDSSFSSSKCPTSTTTPGVWGNGSGSALWSYPVATIDFDNMRVDLGSLETTVQTGGGIYLAAAAGVVNSRGYHLIFQSDGTVEVRLVESTDQIWGYSNQQTPILQYEYNTILTETTVGTYAIPSDCSVIYVNDRVWVEGVVNGKVTVVAATPSDGATSPDIILPGNITYTTQDGSDGLAAIAERNVLIPVDSPDNMEIHGIFIATNGRYARNYYFTSGSYAVPAKFTSGALQTTLTTIGTVVSFIRTGTSWTSGGTVVGGYQNRYDYYNLVQAFAPPPFTSAASSDYSYALWREL